MIRALVAEDEPPAREKLTRWLEESGAFAVVASVGDGVAAAEAIASLQPAVAFLDIRMPAPGGIELAAQLEAATAPLIVFVTAFDEYAVQAFDLNAVDYLLKPYDRERFDRMVARVQERIGNPGANLKPVQLARSQAGSANRLLVPQRERWVLIESADIDWLEADDNYVHVHTTSARYLLRRTLQDLLLQLGEHRFARVHKSAAVNIEAIRSLAPLFKGDHDVQLRSGTVVRMSRRYKDALFARLGK